jgi:salicylate hydroxylase
MYNGINVLDKVPGLLECVDGYPRDEWHFYSVLEQDKGFLGKLMHPKRHDGPHGYGTMSIMRPTLIRRIIEFAQKEGVEVKWGHQLDSLTQDDQGVTLKFSNGNEERFSFVVGCDGLRSNTRRAIFGEQPADYTGISMVCWGSYIPPGLSNMV